MDNLPNHIAIIPDGNRRWASRRSLPTIEGHRRGFNNAMAIAKYVRQIGISTLSLWAFSTENWDRSLDEVSYLMRLFEKVFDRNLKDALVDEAKIVHIGRKNRIPENLLRKIDNAEERTKKFTKHYLNIALDYGGRDEIVRAIKKIQNSTRQSAYKAKNLVEEDISHNLDMANQPYPNPDIIIRTGKEFRLSGFMLWQSQYSELFFPQVYFPEFTTDHLHEIILEYQLRKRRFGR